MAEKNNNQIKLVKKLETFTNAEGVQVQTHGLYIVKPNGWKIKIRCAFKGHDYYDLLDLAEEEA